MFCMYAKQNRGEKKKEKRNTPSEREMNDVACFWSYHHLHVIEVARTNIAEGTIHNPNSVVIFRLTQGNLMKTTQQFWNHSQEAAAGRPRETTSKKE